MSSEEGREQEGSPVVETQNVLEALNDAMSKKGNTWEERCEKRLEGVKWLMSDLVSRKEHLTRLRKDIIAVKARFGQVSDVFENARRDMRHQGSVKECMEAADSLDKYEAELTSLLAEAHECLGEAWRKTRLH